MTWLIDASALSLRQRCIAMNGGPSHQTGFPGASKNRTIALLRASVRICSPMVRDDQIAKVAKFAFHLPRIGRNCSEMEWSA